MPRASRHSNAIGTHAGAAAAASSSSTGRPAAAAASSSSSRRSTAADMNLLEESRQTPLGECFSQQQLPFLWACATGNTSEVKKLLAEEQVEQQTLALKRIEREARGLPIQESSTVEETFLQQVDSCGWTALHWAAAFGHVDILQLISDSFLDSLPETMSPSPDAQVLLRKTCDAQFMPPIYLFINRTTAYQDTPLHIAAYNCHTGAMAWLAAHGADVRLRNFEGQSSQLGQTPLMCIVEKKIGKGCQARQEEACRWMLKYVREKEEREWMEEDDIEEDEPEAVTTTPEGKQLEGAKSDAQVVDLETKRRLQRASTEQMTAGKPKTILVYRQIEREVPEHKSQTNPAAAAPAAASTTTADDASSSFKTERKDDTDLAVPAGAAAAPAAAVPSAFALSASTPPEKLRTETVVVKMEVDDDAGLVKEDEPVVDTAKRTASTSAPASPQKSLSASSSSPLLAPRLFPLLSSINYTRESGSTALMMASFGGNYRVVLALLENGALVNQDVYDVRGKPVPDSALLNAIDEAHVHIVRLLLEWGANRFVRNGHGETPALLVCSSDQDALRESESLRLEFLHCLFTEGLDSKSLESVREYYLTQADSFGATPFIWAVRRGCVRVVEFLLDRGCDPAVRDPSSGETVMRQLSKRITKGKAMHQGATAAAMAASAATNSKKASLLGKHQEHVRMCRLMHLLLHHERCKDQADLVSAELKQYVQETVVAADQAVALAAAQADKKRAAPAEARKRPRPAPTAAAAPSAAPSVKKKAKVEAATTGARAAKSSTPAGSAKPQSKAPTPRKASAAKQPPAHPTALVAAAAAAKLSAQPARFFKGGRQQSAEDALLPQQQKKRKQQQQADATKLPKRTMLESTDEDDTDESDEEDEQVDTSEQKESHEAAPAPARIQGTIGAKLQKKQQDEEVHQQQQDQEDATAMDAITSESTQPMKFHGGLDGAALTFASQIDDRMLDVEHTPMEPHHHLASEEHHHHHLSAPSEHALRHDDGDVDYPLHLPSSPLKFSASSSLGDHPTSSPSSSSIFSKRRSPTLLHDSLSSSHRIALEPFRRRELDGADEHHLGQLSLMRQGSGDGGGSAGDAGGAQPTGASSLDDPDDKFGETRKRLQELGLGEYIPSFVQDKVYLSEWAFLIRPENNAELHALLPHMGPRSKFRAWVVQNCTAAGGATC